LSEETDRGTWVGEWADRIEASGLSPIALLLLHVGQAFGFLGSQALLLVQPLVMGVVSDVTFERTVALLDSPELLGELRARLEGEGS
jgi:hypothetical protein